MEMKASIEYCPKTSMYDLIVSKEVDGQNQKQIVCSFCNIQFGALKIYTIENVKSINKTQLIIRDKDNTYSISQYEDRETLIGDWAKAVSKSKVSRQSSFYNSNEKNLYLLFINALNEKYVNHEEQLPIFESLMIYKNDNNEYVAPDINTFTTYFVEKSEGKFIYKPLKDDTNLFYFKKIEILKENQFKELENNIRDFSRSEEELSIYKTLICWTITGMIKKQLIDLNFGLYPAVVLIGEKKGGKSTAMKTFCDVGIKDYIKTGNNIRETTIKNLFNTTFPVLFDEISNINIQLLDIFKSGLTQGFLYSEKGKFTGASGESYIHRKINPFIFSANTLTISDEALMRRLIIIDYPRSQNGTKTNLILSELHQKMKGFYKYMFLKCIPDFLNEKSLKHLVKTFSAEYKDERMIYLKVGEMITNHYGFLMDVPLLHNDETVESGGKTIVQEKDIIYTDIKRVILTLNYKEKTETGTDKIYTVENVLRENVASPVVFDLLSASGVYVLKAKKKEKILVTNEIIPLLDSKLKNKYKNITQIARLLEKENEPRVVELPIGNTNKRGIVFTYEELFGEGLEYNDDFGEEVENEK